MRPDEQFRGLPKHFWANVRTISQKIGYTDKATKQIRIPSLPTMAEALQALGLATTHLAQAGQPTEFGQLLQAYFSYRATILNEVVQGQLMDLEEVRPIYETLYEQLQPTCPLPLNKQKGEKKTPAYLTGIVNMLIEANVEGLPYDYDPRELTTITRDNVPLRTLARRVDGAFPAPVNPIALWEIKEYYYTTTFGSRVADGVYETLLDGMELEELREHEQVDVRHYLMVDSHFTWWVSGRSYLCRMVDMLHMGYVDEVLFGREVVDRLPELVKEWVALARMRGDQAPSPGSGPT